MPPFFKRKAQRTMNTHHKMRWLLYLFYGWLLSLPMACQRAVEELPIQWQQPPHFPKPAYNFERNPITTAGFQLGKRLFYDRRLSRDNSISCGSCHIQSSAFTHHGHDVSHGIDDQLTLRNAPPIMNLAWHHAFGWDGGVFSLDLFAISPIEAHNEMDETLENVLNKLRKDPEYRNLFRRAFGSEEITTARFLMALAQFQLMAVSANSKYDRYLQGLTALSALEKEGLRIFEQKCAACHSGVLFTDLQYRNNGLPPRRVHIEGVDSTDTGRHRVTLLPEDMFKFKVPSLRNLRYTAPYMHDGRFATLEEVLDHYSHGVMDSPTLDPLLRQAGGTGIPLSEEEKTALMAFLETLNDESFVRDPRLSEF
jgi:cytochrome c peroxidase